LRLLLYCTVDDKSKIFTKLSGNILNVAKPCPNNIQSFGGIKICDIQRVPRTISRDNQSVAKTSEILNSGKKISHTYLLLKIVKLAVFNNK